MYRLRKAPNKDLYWVVGEDGTKHSKEPLPRERAEAQMKALYVAMRKEGGGIADKVNMLLASVPQMGGVSIPKPAFIKEHKNLLGVLKRGKKSELRAEAQDQAQELAKVQGGCWECRGGGPIPDRNILQQLATQSYKEVPVNRIGQFELVRFTPTLKFYKDNGNTIIVAIRGTKTTADWTDANSRIAIGQLENSDRYKTDLNTLTQFQTQFPPSQYDYYGVGHSLGGAILDLFLKAGLIKNGVSYNPAVQPQDFQNTTLPNERIYTNK